MKINLYTRILVALTILSFSAIFFTLWVVYVRPDVDSQILLAVIAAVVSLAAPSLAYLIREMHIEQNSHLEEIVRLTRISSEQAGRLNEQKDQREREQAE